MKISPPSKLAAGFELTGLATTGYAEIAEVTRDFQKAVSGAEVIFVTALSTRHEALASAMVPYLKDGQTILFSAGSLRLYHPASGHEGSKLHC